MKFTQILEKLTAKDFKCQWCGKLPKINKKTNIVEPQCDCRKIREKSLYDR